MRIKYVLVCLKQGFKLKEGRKEGRKVWPCIFIYLNLALKQANGALRGITSEKILKYSNIFGASILSWYSYMSPKR
jgi:hypothetical protein